MALVEKVFIIQPEKMGSVIAKIHRAFCLGFTEVLLVGFPDSYYSVISLAKKLHKYLEYVKVCWINKDNENKKVEVLICKRKRVF